jgi:hypothetical protein
MSRGKIHGNDSLFLRMRVGETGSGDTVYELTVSASDHSPIIMSKTTGKWFTLSWQDLVGMAVEAGIDDPSPMVGDSAL